MEKNGGRLQLSCDKKGYSGRTLLEISFPIHKLKPKAEQTSN